jgi:hypothetical protein
LPSTPSIPSIPSTPSVPRYDVPPYYPTYDIFAGKYIPTIFKKKGKRITEGFGTFVKRKGKWWQVGQPVSKGEAIKRGEMIAIKTLARSFKVRRSSVAVEEFAAPEYQPSPKIFRAFRKVKGRKIPLQDEWIQRRKYSLATRGERIEIKASKRLKMKGGFKLR